MATTETRPDEDKGTKREPTRTESTVTGIVVMIVAVLAVVALVAHFGYGWNPGSSPVTSASGPPAAGAKAPEVTPTAVGPLAGATPLRGSIPSIGANSSLIALGQNADQSLTVPPLSQPMQASWFDKSPTPGQIGPSVILGHVNGGGKRGIFADLDKVQAGQQVSIDRADGQTAVFTVAHVDLVPKDAFPTDQVYGDTTDSQLRLITCGGELDRAAHSYKSNVVVYATLTSVHRT